MANHHVTIAKAAFAAVCLRPDVTQLSRDEISKFHTLLEAAVSRCSPLNVQTCKKWLIHNVIPSLHRTAALGKYLVSYSKYAEGEEAQATTASQEPSAEYKRLHLLYILNDLLHHAKYHATNPILETNLREVLKAQLVDFFQLVRPKSKTRIARRLEDLLGIWEQEQYFGKESLAHLRKGITSNELGGNNVGAMLDTDTRPKTTPYVMPATHGDPTIPYYDLPAANLMPHIVPNKSIPIRPDQIHALQLSAGPADESLVNAVKDFLKEVNRVDNPYQSLEDAGIVAEMDELGQLSYRNETDELTSDTYYGWSREFCDKMTRRIKEDGTKNRHGGRSRTYSRSRSSSDSRSLSRSPPKRMRYENSRSRSPARSRHTYHSYSRSQSPDRRPVAFQPFQTPSIPLQQPVPTTFPSSTPKLPYPSLPLGPNGLPLPLPRPPNYNGPWPPPPPPQPPSGFTNTRFLPPTQYTGPNVSPPFGYQGSKR